MKKPILGLLCLFALLASSMSSANPKYTVIRNGERIETNLARVGVTILADGSALLVFYGANDVTGNCSVKVKNPADAVALSNKIVSNSKGLSIFCMRENG